MHTHILYIYKNNHKDADNSKEANETKNGIGKRLKAKSDSALAMTAALMALVILMVLTPIALATTTDD